MMTRTTGSSLKLAVAVALAVVPRVAGAAEPSAPAAASSSPSEEAQSSSETLPDDSSKPIPLGYHRETRLTGPILMTCGGLVFAASAFFAIAGFTAHEDNDGVARAVGRAGLVGMALSAPVAIVGATLPVHVLRRNESASLTIRVTPWFARNTASLGVTGAF